MGSGSDRQEAVSAIFRHVINQDPPQNNVASLVIQSYYPNFTLAAVKTLACQVLCMIAEFHMACVTRGSSVTSPILPKEIVDNLPPLVDYDLPEGSGVTDVRVSEHKARSLCVGVWLHRMDMTLSEEREA